MALKRKTRDFSYTETPAASAIKYWDFASDPTLIGTNTDDYLPFSNVTVFNNGSTDLKYRENQQDGYKYIPAGTIMELNNREIMFASIENVSSTTAGSYIVVFNNDVSQLEVLKKLAEKMGVQ